nr:RNA-directed DNA polymerase, eukaryota, reverse transcriptase zinc-binding domain protein [Tanacetum cinerariifolium]
MMTDKDSSAPGTHNRPPMSEENDYESWRIRIERYIKGKPHGKLIWKSIQNGPTPHPQTTDPAPEGGAGPPSRNKRDEEFTEEDNRNELADIQAINILSQGLPIHIFNILNQNETGREIWDVVSSANGSSPVSSSLDTTPKAEMINKLEIKMLNGKLIFVDDDGKPLNKVDSKSINSDSDSDIEVDFEKAYDSVRWDFLNDILKFFGFGEKWCKWIQSCLRSSRGLIIINGSPTKEFQFFKGLKQGEPLSPFLFILIMESLHLSFQRVVDAGIFKDFKLSSSLSISHMFYADDTVFVGQCCDGNITTLVHVLECFYRALGLRINMSKSKIMGVLVDSDKVKCDASKLGCLILKTPFSYLGSKVG